MVRAISKARAKESSRSGIPSNRFICLHYQRIGASLPVRTVVAREASRFGAKGNLQARSDEGVSAVRSTSTANAMKAHRR